MLQPAEDMLLVSCGDFCPNAHHAISCEQVHGSAAVPSAHDFLLPVEALHRHARFPCVLRQNRLQHSYRMLLTCSLVHYVMH